MENLIVRYRVKKERIENVKSVIRKFVSKVKDNEPETLVYESFQSEKDEQEFVHYMKFATEAAEKMHRKTGYCKKFVSVLYPMCEREPKHEKLIGFY